jgi:hypothetical protein
MPAIMTAAPSLSSTKRCDHALAIGLLPRFPDRAIPRFVASKPLTRPIFDAELPYNTSKFPPARQGLVPPRQRFLCVRHTATLFCQAHRRACEFDEMICE